MNLLYLHPSAAFGGSSKSLIEVFLALRGVSGTVVVPAGSASKAFEKAGLNVVVAGGLSQFDNTRYGFYRGLRWLILLREIFFLPSSIAAICRLRRGDFDLLHINEITLLPIGLFAKWHLGIPLVVHVRSLQRATKRGLRTRLTHFLLNRHASAIIAIDHTVANSLGQDLPVTIIHNSLNWSAIDVSQKNHMRFRAGFLGVLIPLKGIFELVEAVRILVKERGYDLECLIAGENARKITGLQAWLFRAIGFARDVRGELGTFIKRHGLQNHIRMLGFIGDVQSLYPQLDILCFPSHLNAAGRPVFEAAFFGVPSIVAIKNPLPDAVIHRVTGLAIPSSDPLCIADALEELISNPELGKAMGENAKKWARDHFDIEENAIRLTEVYRSLMPK